MSEMSVYLRPPQGKGQAPQLGRGKLRAVYVCLAANMPVF